MLDGLFRLRRERYSLVQKKQERTDTTSWKKLKTTSQIKQFKDAYMRARTRTMAMDKGGSNNFERRRNMNRMLDWYGGDVRVFERRYRKAFSYPV